MDNRTNKKIDTVQIINKETGIAHRIGTISQLEELTKEAEMMTEYHQREYLIEIINVDGSIYPYLMGK